MAAEPGGLVLTRARTLARLQVGERVNNNSWGIIMSLRLEYWDRVTPAPNGDCWRDCLQSWYSAWWIMHAGWD